MGRGQTVRRQLDTYRKRIDGIDRRIVRLLKRRFDLVRAVGELKREAGLAVVQPEREAEVLGHIAGGTRKQEVREFLTSVYRAVFRASYRVEDEQ
jgi:monofunctional chorismate mutase